MPRLRPDVQWCGGYVFLAGLDFEMSFYSSGTMWIEVAAGRTRLRPDLA
jgi:hypothetical protein